MGAVITREGYLQERLTPDPDGVTTVFQTSYAYDPQSVEIWRNGLLTPAQSDNGYFLMGGTSIAMKIAPQLDDVLEARYNLL